MRMSRILHAALSLHIVIAHEEVLSSPIRTIPSALELPQILPLHTQEWLAGSTADQELRRLRLLSPCPEDIAVFNYDAPMIAYSEGTCPDQGCRVG